LPSGSGMHRNSTDPLFSTTFWLRSFNFVVFAREADPRRPGARNTCSLASSWQPLLASEFRFY